VIGRAARRAAPLLSVSSTGLACPVRRSAPCAKRLAAAGRELGAREAPHRAALEEAGARCAALRARVQAALEAFQAEAAAAGAPHLALTVSEPRLDDKHVRAFEFEVARGRHVGVVVVKAKREIALVGPFQRGKQEGPCRRLPFDAPEDELDAALAAFLERLVEEAATP
jgi:hypothetical protein